MPFSDTKPHIPDDEYPRRWAQVQALMRERELDLVLAYADDRAVFGPAHARWLADVPVHFEPMCVLVRPAGEPILLCGPESDQYAIQIGKLRDVRVLREFAHPDEDYPYSQIIEFARVAREATDNTGAIRRIGVAGKGLMGADFAASLRAALPGAEWVDIENAMCALRAQKSPAEVAVIRHAYQIAELGIAAAVTAIRAGVTEREVAAEAESAMRRAGAEGTGIDTIVASGPNSRPILARSTFRRIESPDLVLLTVAPRYEGYHAAIGRPVLVSHVGVEIEQAVSVACRAQEASFAAMRPGAKGRDVEALGRRVVADAGMAQYFPYSGLHSVGVIEFEPPIFGPSSANELAENMIISIDIPLFNAPWGGLRIEDGFLITATGAERLNHTDFVLRAGG
ncbi:MAG: aminopeptidase P family protein [Chloroflexi bacterium]|nr:aminopeptidase P family protein [Chloroflexota bacterium]